MRLPNSLRQISSHQTLETLKRSIAKTIAEAAPHIQAAKENQVKILSQKFGQFNDWYMKITGLDKVNFAQEKVTGLQNQLLDIQEKRRHVGRQLSEIRTRSIELQDELHQLKRQDDLEKFLDLMKKETEVLKLEKSISKTFQDYDQTERELFTAFIDSIRDSHEKQRLQMEYTKYFGIVLSIVGSFLAFVYSTLRKEQLKQIIDERLQFVNNSEFQPADVSKIVEQAVNVNKVAVENVVANVCREKMDELGKYIIMQKEKNSSPVIDNDDIEEETKGFFNLNSPYVKVFGVIFGLMLIKEALSG